MNLPNALGFPGPQVLTEVIRKWKPDPMRFIGSSLLPVKDHPVPVVEWDEYGSPQGLTSAHAPGTTPTVVKMPVRKHHTEATMYFKETQILDETDILNIRQAGTYDKLAGEAEAMRMAENLNLRLESRLEQLRWAALQGSVAINENGIVRTISYTLNSTPTAAVLWSDTSKANPIADMQSWVEALRGKATGSPKAYMNKITAKYLSQNETVKKLVRQSSAVLQLGVGNVGNLVSELAGGIDSVIVYDEGYIDTSGTYTPFIPDGKVLIIGGAPMGETLGYFRTTPTVHNGGLNPRPGKFVFVEDKLNSDTPSYRMTTGIYGVPTLSFPDCVILATVA